MKIAVTSQNRKTVTGHAGKCRKFWVYDVEGSQVKGRNLLELPMDQTFHESHGPHPLDGIHALISGGMGSGMRNRMLAKGIEALVTTETDPDRAVAAWLNGTLPQVEGPLEECHDHHHDHDHHHEHHHDHGHDHHHAHHAMPAFIAGLPLRGNK